MKRCPRCHQEKPLDAFPRNRSRRSGRGTYCKPCHTEVVRENRVKNHGSHRNYLLSLRYGIDAQTFQEILAVQGGACAICAKPNPSHVDHDHETGEVRGLLCFNCNGGLGRFKDDPERIGRAIEYLEAHGKS